MKKITIEDIDQMALDIRVICCPIKDVEKRNQFELDVYNYLKEALDPWRK